MIISAHIISVRAKFAIVLLAAANVLTLPDYIVIVLYLAVTMFIGFKIASLSERLRSRQSFCSAVV